MAIYYFAYGSNLSDTELEKFSFRYDWKKFCYLENYELKLNHISIPFLIPSYFKDEPITHPSQIDNISSILSILTPVFAKTGVSISLSFVSFKS